MFCWHKWKILDTNSRARKWAEEDGTVYKERWHTYIISQCEKCGKLKEKVYKGIYDINN